MPKGKRKIRAKQKGDSDEESIADNASTVTALSDNRSSEGGVAAEEEEASQDEIYEEKLKEAIDGLSLKSAQARVNALNSVTNALTYKIVPEFLSDRIMTLTDGIERCLRKGKGAEQAAAAHLAVLVCFQDEQLAQELNKSVSPILQILSKDNSVSHQVRGKCCNALALMSFLADGVGEDIAEPMQCLQSIFSGSFLKGNGCTHSLTTEEQGLHASALSAWSILLTLAAPYHVYSAMSSSSECTSGPCPLPRVNKLGELLESSCLEVRMAAGEAICLAYEIGREQDEEFEAGNMEELCCTLEELAKESHKYRAKKDRKLQRASFREILHYIQEESSTETAIKFGHEQLLLDSWCRKKQYDVISSALGSGINFHLAENLLLRDVFQLGDRKTLLSNSDLKISKHDRHLANAAAFKHRTITRGKNRDKRSSTISSY